jgi:hypothetical protein
MANSDDGSGRTLYVLKGSKQPGQRVGRVVVEGTMHNPIRQAILNGPPVALTDDEYADLKQSYRWSKAGEESEEDTERKSAGETVETREQQQEAQAEGAPPAAEPTMTTHRPAAKSRDKS